MRDKFHRYHQIWVESVFYCKNNNLEFHILPQLSDEFWSLECAIRQYLLKNPGTLIYSPDELESIFLPNLITQIWEEISNIQEENGDEYCDLLGHILSTNIIEDSIERAQKYPPQFILVNPEILDFNRYFEQAFKAYIYGLNGASCIIACSFLEMALKEKMNEFELVPADLRWEVNDKGERKPIGVCFNFSNIINKAYEEKIIDKNDRNTLHRIRKLRNDVIHENKEITSEKSLETIMQMKTVFEHLFKDEKSSA